MADDESEPPDDRFVFGSDSITPEVSEESEESTAGETADGSEETGSHQGDHSEAAEEGTDGDAGDDDGPLGGLAREVSGRRSASAESEDLFEEAFAEMDTADVDVEEVWADLEDGAVSREHGDAGDEPEVRVQDKHVCHGCEYFSEPPQMYCNHEGTEIREVVDAERYEVVDCPKVAGDDFE
jgi:hypothetical protein